MSETVLMEVRIAVTVDVPNSWAGPLLTHVPGGGIEPEPPVNVSPVKLIGRDGRVVESMAAVVLSARPLGDARPGTIARHVASKIFLDRCSGTSRFQFGQRPCQCSERPA